MPAVTRATLQAPVLRKQAVACPALGGDVVVRMLKLSERLALMERMRTGGEAGRYAQMAELLAVSVIDAESGAPLMSADEWDLFAAEHWQDALALMDAAKTLSGFDAEAVEKN